MKDKKKLNKKVVFGGISLVILIFIILGYFLIEEEEVVQNVRVGNVSSSVYDNYTGETVVVDKDVKKQVDLKIVEKREEATESKSTNIEHIPVDAKYISVKDGVDIKDFFKDEFIPCVTSDYDENGFHCLTGFNREGFNKAGVDINGFGEDGCNEKGFNILGDKCANYVEPVVEDCIDGADEFGNLCGEFEKFYDQDGCDEDGLNIDGEPCKVADVVKVAKKIEPICLSEDECLDRSRYMVSLDEEERVWYENRLSRKTSAFAMLTENKPRVSFKIKPKESFVTYVEPTVDAGDEDVAGGNDDKPDFTQTVNDSIQIPTGTMLNVKWKSDINSDYGGTVRAVITGGPLSNAEIFGTFSVPFIANVHLPRDKVGIKFDKIVYKRQTIAIDAIGLDSESLNDFIGGKVNNHYVLRWGGLVGSTFLKGLGDAVSSGRESAYGDGSNNIIQSPITGTSDQLKVAFGEVGGELAQIARDQFSRPPTVTINKNSSRGSSFPIVFMSEVIDDRLPMIFSRNEQIEINRRMMLNPNLFKN